MPRDTVVDGRTCVALFSRVHLPDNRVTCQRRDDCPRATCAAAVAFKVRPLAHSARAYDAEAALSSLPHPSLTEHLQNTIRIVADHDEVEAKRTERPSSALLPVSDLAGAKPVFIGEVVLRQV